MLSGKFFVISRPPPPLTSANPVYSSRFESFLPSDCKLEITTVIGNLTIITREQFSTANFSKFHGPVCLIPGLSVANFPNSMALHGVPFIK